MSSFIAPRLPMCIGTTDVCRYLSSLRHGDLLFVGYTSQEAPAEEQSAQQQEASTSQSSKQVSSTGSGSSKIAKKPWELVKEDPVDSYWEAQEGTIKRKRDPHFCRHGEKSMCDHCMPLEVSLFLSKPLDSYLDLGGKA